MNKEALHSPIEDSLRRQFNAPEFPTELGNLLANETLGESSLSNNGSTHAGSRLLVTATVALILGAGLIIGMGFFGDQAQAFFRNVWNRGQTTDSEEDCIGPKGIAQPAVDSAAVEDQ